MKAILKIVELALVFIGAVSVRNELVIPALLCMVATFSLICYDEAKYGQHDNNE